MKYPIHTQQVHVMIGTEIVSPPHIMITELLTTVFINERSYWFSYHGVTGLEYHENI